MDNQEELIDLDKVNSRVCVCVSEVFVTKVMRGVSQQRDNQIGTRCLNLLPCPGKQMAQTDRFTKNNEKFIFHLPEVCVCVSLWNQNIQHAQYF